MGEIRKVLLKCGDGYPLHRLKLTIHTPIYPKGKGEENLKELMTESYQAIESGLPEKYRN